LVNVNAVYSKYSLAPLKNLNFGPMQYGENVTRSFEIRNEGLFDFDYAICDYNNADEMQKIKDKRKREAEERLNGAKKEDVVDPKAAAGKKPDPKAAPPAKAGAKGGKGEVIPDGQIVNVSQYAITPAIGSIAPGSAAVISITFSA
jgi:hydrocephalus-inducing protein